MWHAQGKPEKNVAVHRHERNQSRGFKVRVSWHHTLHAVTYPRELNLLFSFFPEGEAFDMVARKLARHGKNRSDTRSGNPA